jgi:DNA-binding GntR family transcriptional regulator
VTVKDITEVFQLRAVLEGLAVHLAVEFITDQELDQLAAELAAAEIALNEGNTLLCSEKSRRIHRTLVDQAHNERLALLIRNLDDHVQRFRVLSDRISGRLGKSLQQHHRVLEALRQRNAGEAEEAMREHLLSVLQDLTAAGD